MYILPHSFDSSLRCWDSTQFGDYYLHIYTFAFYLMDNEEIEDSPRDITKWLVAWTAVIIFGVFLFSYFQEEPESKKNTLDDRMKLIEDMRAEKKSYEQKITDLNQRIVKQKCDVFSEVKAKTQWEQDCQEVFEQQKSVTE